MPYNSKFGQVVYAAGEDDDADAAAAFPVQNLSYNVENTQEIVNNLNRGSGLPGRSRPGSKFAETSFEMELIGTDTADEPTPLGSLFRAVGFAESAPTGSTPNIYFDYTLNNNAAAFRTLANSGNIDHVDLTVNLGQTLNAAAATQTYACTNMVARSANFRWAQNEIPRVAFDFVGIGAGTAIASGFGAGVNAAWTATADPVNSDNLSLTWGGVTLVVRSFEIQITNTVNQRPDRNTVLGYATPMVTGRDVVYTLEYETVPVATWNPGTLFQAGTKQALSLVYNTAGGVRNKTTITSDAYVNTSDQPSPDSDNIQVSTVTLRQSRTSGDELLISYAA